MHGHYFVGTELFKSKNIGSEEIISSFETISVYEDLADTTENAEICQFSRQYLYLHGLSSDYYAI
jgi:hypothetical protein